jgi:hypothetical protein
VGVVSPVATGPTPRTRPRLLVAVVVAGVAAALGIRAMGGGSDGPTTIGELAAPAAAEQIPTDAPTTAVPAVTVPAPATTTGSATATTVPGAPLSTIPWTTDADGSRREPFTFLPVPTEPTADLSADANNPDDVSVAAGPSVPVPTIGGSIVVSGTGDTTDDTVDDTATTLPVETTTTRSPTLGLVTRSAGGYWLFQADGSVYASRADTWYGDLRTVPLTSPVVGMQATPTGKGYYLVSRDGGVFAFGDAVYDGSIPETLARQLESMLDDGYLAPTTTTLPGKHR